MALFSPRFRRSIACFLLIEISLQALWPTVSIALTAGPTAPEATTFEPIDTNDLVSAVTGDFVYNVPILEVPGPDGGFPVNMFYHGGIQPDVEATWVGLGWGLNPGAINRNVNGIADDRKGVRQDSDVFSEIGTRSTTSLGIRFGVHGDMASVNAGISLSDDSNEGFGVGWYAGAGAAAMQHSGLNSGPNASIGIGSDGYGHLGAGVSAGFGVSYNEKGTGSASIGANVGLSTNFSTITPNAGVSGGLAVGGGSISASYGTGGSSATAKFGPVVRTLHNSSDNPITVLDDSWTMSIPGMPVSPEIGQSNKTFIFDDKETSFAYGSLYYPKTTSEVNAANFSENTYDTYRLLDPANENPIDNPDPDWIQGGTFPAYDDYIVNSPGNSGVIRPYALQSAVYGRNRPNPNNATIDIQSIKLPYWNQPTNSDHKLQFRYENDFSNRYTQEEQVQVGTSPDPFGSSQSPNLAFDHNPVFGNGDSNFGYDPARKWLAGSKYVEWFSIDEIYGTNQSAKGKGFIGTNSLRCRGFAPYGGQQPIISVTSSINMSVPGPAIPRTEYEMARAADRNQIGGFMITNESGVTYHYALPAYSWDEYIHTESVHDPMSNYRNISKAGVYAYTWYLTAITGPDYVDYDEDGLVGEGDFGYWVSLEYGKWTDAFIWRNPFKGFRQDLDGNFRSFSTGLKEVYYLNSIKTATHTALFEKELRQDGKSCTFEIGNPIGTGPDGRPGPLFSHEVVQGDVEGPSGGFYDKVIFKYPKTALALKRIILLKNSDVPSDLVFVTLPGQQQGGSRYNINNIIIDNGGPNWSASEGRCHYGDNVLDEDDISISNNIHQDNLVAKSIRTIDMGYDYSLVPETVNTVKDDGTLQVGISKNDVYFRKHNHSALVYNPYLINNPGRADPPRTGKLTLRSIKFNGVGGQGDIPATRFDYEVDASSQHRGTLHLQAILPNETNVGTALVQEGSLETGDLISFSTYAGISYATLLDKVAGSTNQYRIMYLKNRPPTLPMTNPVVAVQTKNPPYLQEHQDSWGMFKSDFDISRNGPVGSAFNRQTTAISAKNTDVWSLRRIHTPTGATITVDYEADSYDRTAFDKGNRVIATVAHSEVGLIAGAGKLFLRTETPLSNSLKVGDRLLVTAVVMEPCGGTSSVVRNVLVEVTNFDNYYNASGPYFNGLKGLVVEEVDSQHKIFANSTCMLLSRMLYGYLSYAPTSDVRYGDGLRTKSITVSSSSMAKSRMYDYSAFGSTSGVSSCEPDEIASLNKADLDRIAVLNSSIGNINASLNELKNAYYDRTHPLMKTPSEAPSAGVMYEYVTVRNRTVHQSASTVATVESPRAVQFQFEVLKPSMIGIVSGQFMTSAGDGCNYRRHNVSVKDYTSRVGALKRVVTLGKTGEKLHELINHYAHDDFNEKTFEENADKNTGYQTFLNTKFNAQGVVQECYGDARLIQFNNTYCPKVVMSKRDHYPTVKQGTTTIDYVTGLRAKSETLAFDFYSGDVLASVATDSYGNIFKAVTTPAYRAHPSMGLKVHYTSNKNMLVQQAASYVYKLDNANSPVALLSANAQTWSNQVDVLQEVSMQGGTITALPSVWRPQATYQWMPDGSTSDGLTPVAGVGAFIPFNFISLVSNASEWQKSGEVGLYDIYANVLEARDVNANKGATKMYAGKSKALISGSVAGYYELAYCGAEERSASSSSWPATAAFSGGVMPTWTSWGGGASEGEIVRIDAPSGATHKVHTGKSSLKLYPYKHGFSYEVDVNKISSTRMYKASLWSTNPNVQAYCRVDGVQHAITATSTKQAGDWFLVELTIPAIGSGHNTLRVGCYNNSASEAYVDDFRFQPIDADATAYVYDNLTGQMTDILNNDNISLHFSYDVYGRLITTYSEKLGAGLVKSVESSYHYTGQSNLLNRISLSGPSPLVLAAGTAGVFDVLVPTQIQAGTITSVRVDKGTGSGYTPVVYSGTGPISIALNYPNLGTYWVKIKLKDKNSTQRELVKKVVVQ